MADKVNPITIQNLRSRWMSLWNRLMPDRAGKPEWIRNTFEEVVVQYSEPHRAYHDLSHIVYLLEMLDTYRSLVEHPDDVELAIWFHDVIYDTRKSHKSKYSLSNEVKSQRYAWEKMYQAGAQEDVIFRTYGLILVTHHTDKFKPTTNDEKFLADIDWSPLGWPWSDFEANGRAIRHEYHEFSDEEFRLGRLDFFKKAAERDSHFYLPVFKAKFDAQAKSNIAREIARLS